MYKFIEEFFKKNIEMVFAKFDEGLIRSVVERVLILGMQSDLLEAKASSLAALDQVFEFLFFQMQRPNKKQPELHLRVMSFFQQNQALFYYCMRRIAITLLFEDHKSVWVFGKALHSSIVICELCEPNVAVANKIFEEVI